MIYEMTISIKKKMELKFDVYKFFFFDYKNFL